MLPPLHRGYLSGCGWPPSISSRATVTRTRTHKQVCYYSASLGILKLVLLLLLRLVEHHLVFPWKHVLAPILQYKILESC